MNQLSSLIIINCSDKTFIIWNISAWSATPYLFIAIVISFITLAVVDVQPVYYL
jgi:hypothetical protein